MSVKDPGSMVEIVACHQAIAVADGETAVFDTSVDVTKYDRVLVIASIVGATTSTHVITPKSANTAAGAKSTISAAGTLAFSATDDNKTGMLDVRLHGEDKFFNLDVAVTGGTSATFHLVILGWGLESTFTGQLQALSTKVAEAAMTSS